MTVLINNVFPAAITIDLLDAVTDEMNVDTVLPPGGILHVHYEQEGIAYGVDVFESEQAYQTFVETTLIPAMGKVGTERGVDMAQAGPPETTITEVHRLVH